MAKYEIKARKRIESSIEAYTDIVRRAEEAGFNEADTSAIVKDMLGEVLGYDKFFDVTSEYQIKGHYVDYGVKIDNELRFLIETKAIGISLGEKHLFQLIAYSANLGLEWMVLTNARIWQCYHLALAKGSETKLVCEVDLLDENQPLEEKVEHLFLLTREGMWCGALQKHFERLQALDPLTIARTLLSDPVVTVLRREVKKATQYNLGMEDLKESLIHQVMRANIYEQVQQYVSPTPEDTEKVKQGFPAVCWAYVPDSEKPSTWKLRYRQPDGSPDPKLLPRAVAAISPGGHRGRRAQIPPERMAEVKSNLRQAYIELGKSAEEIPEGIR